MLAAFLLFAAQAAHAATPPLPFPDYVHDETVAQAEARAIAFHSRMDADGDGYVTQAEMARYTARLLKGAAIPGTDATHPLPAQSLAYFTATDTNHDGRISLAEAVTAARRDFDLQDTNHDGLVTSAERMAFVMTIAKTGKTPEGVSVIPTADHTRPVPNPWSPPAQAVWPGAVAPVRVTIGAGTASMSDDTSLSLDILATDDGVAVSPFLQATRGIALDVRTMSGEPVAAAEPMPGSPPPPPLGVDQLTALGRTTPFRIAIREKTRTIFPRAGLYRLSAVVSLFDPNSTPARYARVVSAPVTIRVTQ